ncbi:hypothetical protein [Sutterella sp.]|uniref:hypothetical protein n=1 Tax=Sutterella sp. TaxID=1981025 RepID=UPI0026DED0C8|nr:hypothetical protein [Sutterella sp.]MDO5532291.1 hypothetical protein [Sutterella sp.]
MPAPMKSEIRAEALTQLERVLPHVTRLMAPDAAAPTLAEFARSLPHGRRGLQPVDDFIEAAAAQTRKLHGPQTAAKVTRELERRPLALTASHVSLEVHPRFFQGDLLFALGCEEAVPVLSVTNIPLTNCAYPRGLLIASRSAASEMPCEIPLIPRGIPHRSVNSIPPWTESAMRVALGRVMRNAALSEHERVLITRLIHDHCLRPDILRRESLAEQLLALGNTFWDMTTREAGLPPLVTLNHESLTAELIIRDLADPTTLVSRLLTEPAVVLELYRSLSGRAACWHVEEGHVVRGTFLFWAIDRTGCMRPLQPEPDGRALVSSDGHKFRFELKAAPLTEALRTGAIVPGLFLLYSVTDIARGLACAGGILQSAYLPAMAEALARVFETLGEQGLAAQIGVDSPFATGLVPLRAPTADGLAHCPAGPVDLMLAGGLTRDMLEKFAATRLPDAVEASLASLYEHRIPQEKRVTGWQRALRSEPSLLLHPAGRAAADGTGD